MLYNMYGAFTAAALRTGDHFDAIFYKTPDGDHVCSSIVDGYILMTYTADDDDVSRLSLWRLVFGAFYLYLLPGGRYCIGVIFVCSARALSGDGRWFSLAD